MLRQLREKEKNMFFSHLDNLQRLNDLKNQHNKLNLKRNADFVREQIRVISERKALDREVDRFYYKPHFGPEQTAERTMAAQEKLSQMKNELRTSLQKQMNANKELSDISKQQELEADRLCLEAMSNTQNVENLAFVRKNIAMK